MARQLAAMDADHQYFNPILFPSAATVSYTPPQDDDPGRIELSSANGRVDLSDVTAIWHRSYAKPRAPVGLNTADRHFVEAEANSLINGLFKITSQATYWLGDPFARLVADQKPYQLMVATEVGLVTPRTYIGNDPGELLERFEDDTLLAIKTLDRESLITDLSLPQRTFLSAYRRVIKLAGRNPSVEDLSFSNMLPRTIKTSVASELANSASQVRIAPSIFQEYVAKDFEVRATVVGSDVYACAILSQEGPAAARVDFRAAQAALQHEAYDLPEPVSDACVRLARRLGLDLATIDLVVTPQGDHVFLECNADGAWLGVEQLAGLNISRAVAELLIAGG